MGALVFLKRIQIFGHATWSHVRNGSVAACVWHAEISLRLLVFECVSQDAYTRKYTYIHM